MTAVPAIPGHIAIVMDGNGRWAKKRNRPRSMGHQAGLKALRLTIKRCAHLGVETLTVFAFSSENWNRPASEVSRLMELFLRALDKEVTELHNNGICLRFIGDTSAFKPAIQSKMTEAEALTSSNHLLTVNIAVNYGGRWDITQATRAIAAEVESGHLSPDDIDEACFSRFLALSGHLIQTCLFAQVERCESVTSCFGSPHTPSFISPMFCGRISKLPFLTVQFRRFSHVNAVLDAPVIN